MKPRFVIPLFLLAGAIGWSQSDIDFNRARELMQKQKAGQQLTSEERDYLTRAKQLRASKTRRSEATSTATTQKNTSFVPLSEMAAGQTYKGQDGGLYGGGRNEPPAAHAAAAAKEAAKITPLDADGKPAGNGKIVLLGVGMSNTTQEFRRFKEIADADSAKSPQVVVVDGAQGGQDARITSDPKAEFWSKIDERLKQAGVTAKQVQAIWLKQAIARIEGDFPASAKKLQDYLTTIVGILKTRYPNARICYLSSRTYAGYATTPLNPEPYAYESAFAVRWLIEEQSRGSEKLNFDASKGAVNAPLLLWGPYLWANGTAARKDGLAYERGDFGPDGTHPSASGQQKVAQQLLAFFKTEPTARGWFSGSAKIAP